MRGLNNSNIGKLKKQFRFYSVEVRPDTFLAEEELNIEHRTPNDGRSMLDVHL
jgi:hypothetical protein